MRVVSTYLLEDDQMAIQKVDRKKNKHLLKTLPKAIPKNIRRHVSKGLEYHKQPSMLYNFFNFNHYF